MDNMSYMADARLLTIIHENYSWFMPPSHKRDQLKGIFYVFMHYAIFRVSSQHIPYTKLKFFLAHSEKHWTLNEALSRRRGAPVQFSSEFKFRVRVEKSGSRSARDIWRASRGTFEFVFFYHHHQIFKYGSTSDSIRESISFVNLYLYLIV